MISNEVIHYVLDHYLSHGVCGLCGNSGVVDTQTTARNPQGVNVGIRDFCLCANGQTLRQVYITMTAYNRRSRP